jgi:hypothetical protein
MPSTMLAMLKMLKMIFVLSGQRTFLPGTGGSNTELHCDLHPLSLPLALSCSAPLPYWLTPSRNDQAGSAVAAAAVLLILRSRQGQRIVVIHYSTVLPRQMMGTGTDLGRKETHFRRCCGLNSLAPPIPTQIRKIVLHVQARLRGCINE